MTEKIEFQAALHEHRRRLEDVLCGRFSGLSKMYLRELIKTEQCEVNGRSENRGYVVRSNDFVELYADLSRETAMRPENVPLEVLYEDEHLIVVDKPAGMLAHPSFRDRSGTLLNALAFHLNRNAIMMGEQADLIRPGLIHRLDKETSGLMVIAKSLPTHRRLSAQFENKTVTKRYAALVSGNIAEDEGAVNAPIGRFADLKYWGVKDDGKPSVTRFRVERRTPGRTLLELEPVTGRTNQLRIHCEHLGHPIVGDVKRGGEPFKRLCLHAWKLGFRHPFTNEMLEFEKPTVFAE